MTLHVAQTVNTEQLNTVYLINMVCFKYIVVNTLYKSDDIYNIKPLKAELNLICHLLALLGAHHNLHISRIRVK
jgi:hypothetical protein